MTAIIVKNVQLASGDVSGFFDVVGTGNSVDLCRNGKVVVSGYDLTNHEIGPKGSGTSLILDTHGIFYPSYAVSKTGDLTCHDLFLLSVNKLISRFEPRTITFCGEGTSKRCFRKDLFPAYKADRPKKAMDFRFALSAVQVMLKAVGFHIHCSESFEADDVMATIALRHLETHGRVVVASRDKDMLQLNIAGIEVAQPSKDNEIRTIPDNIEPWQFVDYMAMQGDGVDGIPGIKGVGPKTAAKLLAEHGCLDRVLEWASSDKSSAAKVLVENADLVQTCKKLFLLNYNVPIEESREPINLDAFAGFGVQKWVVNKLRRSIR